MSKTATSTVSVTVTGDGVNLTDSHTMLNSGAAVAPTGLTLAAGANTIAIPAGITRVKVSVTASTGPSGLTLKGVSGDTGVPLSLDDPSFLAFAAATPSFVLTASGTVTVLLVWG